MVAKKLGDYEVVSILGKGGFGTVYKAKTSAGDLVAVKILNPGALDDQKIVNKFFHEAIIMAKLDHQNIPKFLDFFFDGQNYGIVMEFVDGMELKKVLRQEKGPLPLDTALKFARQILDAFQYALSHGVLHRDIKPGNIMIDKQGLCKIMDFGIGKIFSSASHGTATSMISLNYIPPERFDQSKDVDARSDIYSLGLVLYEMFTGRRPFLEKEIDRIMYSHLNVIPDPPSQYAPDLPSNISDAILKALEKEPENRFSDFKQFKEAVDIVQTGIRDDDIDLDDCDLDGELPEEQDTDITSIVGRKIGHYEVLGPIGVGRYGSVWKAKAADGKICALKVFKPKVFEDDNAANVSPENTKVLAKLDHPNITKYIDFFRDENKFVVAMEYVEGIELKKILTRQKELLPVALSFKMANQILDALQYAHEQGALHEAIKPRNIMIDKDGNCKVMDFGISNLISVLYGEPSSSRISLHYTAPERYVPSKDADVRSDIYAIGLVFYEMFAGRRAFMVSEPNQIMFHHLNVYPEPPSLYAEDVPREIDQGILKALEKSPEDRFKDFREFKEKIKCVLEIPSVPSYLENLFAPAAGPGKDRAAEAKMVGRRIGTYDIVSPIGVGRFGKVWKATSVTGQLVALKVLDPNVQSNYRVVTKCLNEAKLLAKLDHPNITKFLDFFPDASNFAVAMEYVEGIELKKFLPRQRDLLPFELSFKIAIQILDAFHHAYENKIAHMDFKPRNVLIDKNGDCKIMDFGVANLFSIASGDTSARLISLHYASPESYDPSSTIDARSDIYSIGLVFYEMFAGRRAFMVREAEKIMFHHINVIPDPPSKYAGDLPPEISNATLKALEKDPNDRYHNFLEFRDAIEPANSHK